MDSNPETNLLPFLLEVDQEGVSKAPPDEAELALAMHSLRSPIQKGHTLTKLYWPLYLVRSSPNKYILVEGFGLSQYEIAYCVIPDYSNFLTEITQMEPSKESYKPFIKKIKHFKRLTKKVRYVVDRDLSGCISNETSLREFNDYIKTVNRQNFFVGPLTLTPRLSPDDSLSNLDAINHVKNKTNEDVEALNVVLLSVKKVKIRWIEFMTQSQSALSEKLSVEIDDIRKQTEIRISECELLAEKEKTALEEKTSLYLTALHSRSIQTIDKDTGSRRKKRRSDIKDEIEAAIKERDKKAKRIKQNYANLIEREKRKITSREDYKNKQLRKIAKEAGELDKLIYNYEKLLIKILENKQNDLVVFDKLNMELPRHLNAEAEKDVVQIYMPLYLAKSYSRKQTRILYPKSIRHRKGLFSKLISLISHRSITMQPSLPRFERKNRSKFIHMLRKEKRYENELEEKIVQNNILKKPEISTTLKTGLQYLTDKGVLGKRNRETPP